MKIVIDFETYSPVPIDQGAMKYLLHPDAKVVCAAISEYPHGEPFLWTPSQPIPEQVKQATTIYAHNALFDFRVWSFLTGFPRTEIHQWIDSMALCGRFGLPQSLEKAAQVLGLAQQKDTRGKSLIKLICCPNKQGVAPQPGKDYSPTQLHELYNYCLQDLRTTIDLLHRLPQDTLSVNEQELWVLTQEMNMAGLPVDAPMVKAIAARVESYTKEKLLELPALTGGQITSVTQAQRIRNFCNSRGVAIPDTTADTVNTWLAKELPEDVRTVLELRQELGKSSTAKLAKILELEYNGRVYDNLRYFGAGPGRWSGQGFQVHNLPRATIKHVEETVADFIADRPVANPVHAAKALIRASITAPEGQSLIVSDYSAIECVLLHWVADDHDTLNLIRSGGSQYVDMASFLYKVPYDEIKQGHEAEDKHYSSLRQVGKLIILGCGYGMGAKKFREVARMQKVELTDAQALEAVTAYRTKYNKVQRLWYTFANMTMQAVKFPGRQFEANHCTFRVVEKNGHTILVTTLPSKRSIFYLNPIIKVGPYGEAVFHDGIDSTTKQWLPKDLNPGRITENIIQGLARDIMGFGLQNVHHHMREVTLIATVHDEAIATIQDADIKPDTQKRFDHFLCCKNSTNWTSTIPLTASGYIAKRYKK